MLRRRKKNVSSCVNEVAAGTRACPTDAGGCERAGSRRARTSARNGIPRNDRVSSLCPRSSRDWQPPFDGESRRPRAAKGSERDRERCCPWWSRCSWDRFEQKGAGPGLGARRQPLLIRVPERPVVSPFSSPSSPFSSSSIASRARSMRFDFEFGTHFESRFQLRGLRLAIHSARKWRVRIERIEICGGCRPRSNAYTFSPRALIGALQRLSHSDAHALRSGGPPCAAAPNRKLNGINLDVAWTMLAQKLVSGSARACARIDRLGSIRAYVAATCLFSLPIRCTDSKNWRLVQLSSKLFTDLLTIINHRLYDRRIRRRRRKKSNL